MGACLRVASLLSPGRETVDAAELAKGLIPVDNPMLDPTFFLASLSSSWAPRIVAIKEAGIIVGLVYVKERKVLGLPTGILYADGSLGTMQIGDPHLREDALRLALDALLAHPRTRGIRLKLPPGGPEVQAVRQIIASQPLDVTFSRLKEHSRLILPNDYETFLKSLGSTTRHNFRYYRRRFEAAGHRFEEILSMDELRLAACQLRAKCRRSTSRSALDRLLQMVSAASRRWAFGLKDKDGRWISVAAGCYWGSRAVLFLQLNNDREFGRSSLAVVHRANLIERFIQEGVSDFIFWTGAGPTLSPYCCCVPALVVSLDNQRHGWRLARVLASQIAQWMPHSLAADLRIVAASK